MARVTLRTAMVLRRVGRRLSDVLGVGCLLLLASGSDPSACTGALTEEPECGSDSPRELAACADERRYADDLTFIEGIRTPGSQHWQAVQDHCAEQLADLGFDVELHDYGTGVNVVGVLSGGARADERVVVSAHYDHIDGCAGADDNASGVAGVLETARILARAEYERTLVAACWDEEERDLIGSRAYAGRAASRGERIVASYVYEMIGYKSDEPRSQELPLGFDLIFREATDAVRANDRRGDFIAIISDARSVSRAEEILTAGDQIGLRTIILPIPEGAELDPLLVELRRSDHTGFWENDMPALVLTDTAYFRNDRYHCSFGPDTASVLDTRFATRVVAAASASIARALILQ